MIHELIKIIYRLPPSEEKADLIDFVKTKIIEVNSTQTISSLVVDNYNIQEVLPIVKMDAIRGLVEKSKDLITIKEKRTENGLEITASMYIIEKKR